MDTAQDDYVNCFACGAKSLNIGGECHPYMLAVPGCWEMFNEIMAKEYSDFRYGMGHQFTVDAYACQHIGDGKDARAMRSVHIHLASLYGIFEKKIDVHQAPLLRKEFSQYYKNKNVLQWLDPPASFGELTILELWENEIPELHKSLAEKWARSVWASWSHQHQRIADLVNAVKTWAF